MDLTSPEMKEIGEAISVLHRGEKERGRALLLGLWQRISPGGTPVQLSAMAHFLADTEPDVAGELEWDLRSLDGATGGRNAEDRDPLSPDVASFLPSIHLSVGDCYRRLGQLEDARRHVALAESRIAALPDDGYGKLIRGGLRRLQGLLNTG